MALVVFLRGVNVGGHRTFRPSILVQQLREFDVVNVGAAGTFVVRKPGSEARFRAALLRKLPFATDVMLCNGRDLLHLETEHPFAKEHERKDLTRFLSVMAKRARGTAVPFNLPAEGEWLVQVVAIRKQLVFGVYRRHMKTIRYLGQIDKALGVPVTTRNWNTVLAIVRILKAEAKQ